MLMRRTAVLLLTVPVACALVVLVLNLAANPQLLDWVLPAIVAVVAVVWLLLNMQQGQRR